MDAEFSKNKHSSFLVKDEDPRKNSNLHILVIMNSSAILP